MAEVVMVDLVVMVVLVEVVLEMVLATEGLIHFLNLKDRLALEVEVEASTYPSGGPFGYQGGSGIVVVRYQIGATQSSSVAKATGGSVSFYKWKNYSYVYTLWYVYKYIRFPIIHRLCDGCWWCCRTN